MLKPGDRAPAVSVLLQDGTRLDLSNPPGRPLVLYFYPKAYTRMCVQEAEAFRDVHSELEGVHGARVVGVSRGDPMTHAQFKTDYKLPFDLGSDADGSIGKAFEVSYLGGVVPFSKRITYVIDAEGIVRGAYHHELDPEAHVREVRECLAALASASSPRP